MQFAGKKKPSVHPDKSVKRACDTAEGEESQQVASVVEASIDTNTLFIHVSVNEVACGHEMQQQLFVQRKIMDQMDSLERRNCEQLLKKLQETMDSCVLYPLRNLIEKVIQKLQLEWTSAPDHADSKYRAWAEGHFSGRKEPPCYWEHLKNDACVQRLAFALPHEYTASMYINFANFAGRPFSLWDWSALCSCCENCDLFQMTI